MTDIDEPSNGAAGRRPTVSDVVAVSDRGEGFAYVPGEVLLRGPEAAGRLAGLTGRSAVLVADREEERGERGWLRAELVDRPLEAIDVLVAEGYIAQPNHAMFAHGCGSPCPPHPAAVQELVQYGLFADPMRANPMRANPMRANPMRANPMRANPMRANHPMENSAVPVDGRRLGRWNLSGPGPRPHVVVLDTGLAGQAAASATAAAADHRSPFLVAAIGNVAPNVLPRIRGDVDLPDVAIPLTAANSAPADRYLDPAAGHGTFIAGIIEQLAPGCTIEVRKVIGPLGDAVETAVGNEIHDVIDAMEDAVAAAAEADDPPPPPLIISLSFGGQAQQPPGYLREAVARAIAAGIPIIASAGNDGLCTPQYPAAFPGVIAVAALGPDGPPYWTNYGDWVDACAPGVDLVSAFFDHFDGDFPTVNTYDPDHFSGWAEWSGTSFAVPVVVAAVARELVCGRSPGGNDIDAVTAVERVVRAPHLARLPCLGTVINV